MADRRRLLAAGLVLGVGMVAACSAPQAKLPEGATPPRFIGTAEDWINTRPLTWNDLRGKVVLIDFWEYTCVNCIRTYPYLKAWHKRYSPYGLVIVGIQTPEFVFSGRRANVAGAVKRQGFAWPILNDPERRNWKAYHEHTWPSKYLFDQSGHLVLQHTGEGRYQETEREIQKLLKKTHPDAKFPAPLPPQRPGDRPGVVCRTETRELYTNPKYGYLVGLPAGWRTDKVSAFADHTPRAEGKIYVSGKFVTRPQSIQHARTTTDLRDKVIIRYRGTEVNVVVNRPGGRDYKVYVWLDHKPVPRADEGDDLKYDARGSYFEVTAPRMYNVIRGPYGEHELKLASDSREFDLYSYTFSGCPQN